VIASKMEEGLEMGYRKRYHRLYTLDMNCEKGLENVYYYTDIDVRTEALRTRIGLPTKSQIWPLKGNRLVSTKTRIPGIHWPYAYQSGRAFGSPFTMHTEDYWLISVNFLYPGKSGKVWVVVAPEHVGYLEQKLKATNASYYTANCSQFLRHFSTYIPLTVLEEWNIKYSLVYQKPNEVIVTFRQAYHQGFSTGYTFAEAANYADENWNFDGYRCCEPTNCPSGFIPPEMMRTLSDGEEQQEISEDVEEEEEEEEGEEGEGEEDISKNKRTKRYNKQADGPPKRVKRSNAMAQSYRNEAGDPIPTCRRGIPSFQGLRQIPQNIVQPQRVYDIFIKRCGSENQTTVDLLTRLFFAIGSPNAFYQLQEACNTIRAEAEFTIPHYVDTINQTIQALDHLDKAVSLASIIRRYHLVRLVEHRNKIEALYTSQRPKRNRRILKYEIRNQNNGHQDSTKEQGVSRRAQSLALADVMAEAYPNVKISSGEDYEKKLRFLKNRLSSGRNWHLFEQKFSSGILALVPSGEIYGVQNPE
jgi:JmjC domain, hydroxylase